MLNLSLRISLPYKKWKILKARNVKLTKNWAFELNLYKNNLLLGMHIDTTFKGDHRGLDSSIGLAGYELEFNVYDIRHESIDEYA